MAGYTAPRTWTDGELVTASIMNTHVRDNEVFLKEGVGRVTADISVTSSTAYVDGTGLSFAIGASETWGAILPISFSISGGGDLKTTYSVPSGATGHQWGDLGVIESVRQTVAGDAIWASPGTAVYAGTMHVLVVNSTTAGTVQFRFAQNTSDATATTLQQNSFIVAHRIA